MLQKLKKYSQYQNVYCGVEHTNTVANEQIHFLVLKKKKEALDTEKLGVVNNISELEKELPKNQHLYLIINNEQVLTKKLDGTITFEKAITKAFSNLNRSDFYTEILNTTNNTFVSICRKDIVDPILNTYKKQNLNVIGFSLGNLISSQLSSLINSDTINTSNARIDFENNQISTIQYTEYTEHEKYNINGLEIDYNQLLSLSGIISYYTENQQTQSNFEDVLANLNTNFKQKRVFDVGMKTGLGLILSLLLISFLVFSNYNEKVNQLSNENMVSENLKNTLLKLKAKTIKKRKLFKEVTSSANSKVSFYIDELGNFLPESVLLNRLQYQPKTKAIKKNKEILVHNNSIIIKGKSSDSNQFSTWIESLEKTTWISKVSITNYGTGKKKTTEFELKLSIH